MNTGDRVLVIGAGPSGLATASELEARGVSTSVLERGDQLGAAWAGRYEGLRFNTSRRQSALPGAPFPREYGQFPTRDQYVAYLRQYSADHGIAAETGVDVTGFRREDGSWVVEATSGERHAQHVVLATGVFNRPNLPGWAAGDGFTGEVLHSSEYGDPARFAGKTVLVVGAGSSGMEIAFQLTNCDTRQVTLAIRTPPNILFREVNGRPGDLPVPLLLHLPPAWVDRLLLAVQRRTVGDMSAYGLPAPTRGPFSQIKDDGAGPSVIDPEVLDAIRSGAITCVPAVVDADAEGVVLTDGSRWQPDVIILATGFRTGLADLVGGLGVLDDHDHPVVRNGGEAAPGMRFVGYVHRPGLTGYVGKIAKRVAREIAHQD